MDGEVLDGGGGSEAGWTAEYSTDDVLDEAAAGCPVCGCVCPC